MDDFLWHIRVIVQRNKSLATIILVQHANFVRRCQTLLRCQTTAGKSEDSPTILNLQLTGNIYHVKFGEKDANRPSVLANLILSSDIYFQNQELTVLEDEPRVYDAIIGMDILSSMDYSISNYDNHTIFTLRTPSQAEIKYGEPEDIDLLIDKIEDQFLST